jgi:hypothetical protein
MESKKNSPRPKITAIIYNRQAQAQAQAQAQPQENKPKKKN